MDLSKLTPAPWIARDSRYEPEDWTLKGMLNLDKGIVGWNILGGSEYDPLEGFAVIHGESGNGTIIPERTDLEFIALARNAFDVMMRRGWGVSLVVIGGSYADGAMTAWRARNSSDWRGDFNEHSPICADPFTALVEADQWYKEHVEHATEQGKDKP